MKIHQMNSFSFFCTVKYFTEVQFPDAERKLSYDSKALFFGSCFSENIGQKLEGLKFHTSSNPLGIAYNPVSIAKQIQMALKPDLFDENLVISKDEQFIHFDFHSSFNKRSKAEYLIHAKNKLGAVNKGFAECDFIFLTLGTSIAFKLKKGGAVVNNCHKLDGKHFDKTLLSIEEMESAMSDALLAIQAVNSTAQIILTVSPIRHLRHGSIDNNRSKSRLICLAENLENKFNRCSYLPVYELVMDELRDYRFYRQDDLIHLNDLGVDVIMDRFKNSLIDSKSTELMTRVAKWKQLLAHKIQDGESDSTKKFIENCFNETRELNQILPKRFDAELNALQLLSQK